MRRFFHLAVIPLAALAACDVTEYYAEGRSVADRSRDLAQCEAEALSRYPERLVTRYTPRVFHPGAQTCDASGTCTATPGYWEGGDPYIEDLNEDRRDRALAGCMGRRGYSEIRLPICDPNLNATPSTIMAPLTDSTCVIPARSGALIVSP
ncbi:hypothetical protein [Nioella nitratireducens]|uniref:hypothetical protein n=1 Tax=Nioella nitratireducens TaxID=1287720 RepID=UPI0008FD5C5F|nr:hypothetical protein [Nioella nitratireducens]